MNEQIHSLAELGWSAVFLRQLELDEIGRLPPARIAAVHRDRVAALTETGLVTLATQPEWSTNDMTVGDWVVFDPSAMRIVRLLERKSLLHRRAAGTGAYDQLIAANVDTLFITTSLNQDFNPARLERFLALAYGGGVAPVFVLTKADLCADPSPYLDALREIAPAVPVVLLDARDTCAALRLTDWCGRGQTTVFAGSSGVGKSTLINALTGHDIATRGIREDDAKGRHTTTRRTLYALETGGWVIDTPGMRALRLADLGEGIDAVFADIAEIAENCRFSDCAHGTEPDCAVRAEIEAGRLDSGRLVRWRKMREEEARNAESLAQARARKRSFGKMIKTAKRTLRES
jgi:ribosome biogenesis GTPase